MGFSRVSHSLAELLDAQRGTDRFCDVVLTCGSVVAAAHSCVLAATSHLFERILARSGQDFAKLQVDMSDLIGGHGQILCDVLDFLYVGKRSQLLTDEVMLNLSQRLELRIGLSLPTAKQDRSTSAVDRTTSKKSKKDNIAMDVSFCNKCSLCFISKEEFLAHRTLNCVKMFTCKTCGVMFSRSTGLLEHLLEVRHGETSCSFCDASLASSEMEAHVRKHLEHPNKPNFCLSCEARFSSRYALAQHLPKHSTHAPHICQICTKGFKWKHALVSHMVTHSTDKRFHCPDCDYSTSHVTVFKNHRRVHTGQTLKCTAPECTFETVRKTNLIQHQMTHSKEKPHQCEVCGKSFSQVKNLRRHSLQHDAGATRQRCSVANCNFSSLRSDKFLEHTNRHAVADTSRRSPDDPKLDDVFDAIDPLNNAISGTTSDPILVGATGYYP